MRFLRVCAALSLAGLLSGCIAAAVGASMAGGLAVSEGASTAITPQVEVTGADLYRMAYWDERTERTVGTVFGRSAWVCARGAPGTVICVPPEAATEASVSTSVIFGCRYGQGGSVTNLFGGGNLSTLFCERRGV